MGKEVIRFFDLNCHSFYVDEKCEDCVIVDFIPSIFIIEKIRIRFFNINLMTIRDDNTNSFVLSLQQKNDDKWFIFYDENYYKINFNFKPFINKMVFRIADDDYPDNDFIFNINKLNDKDIKNIERELKLKNLMNKNV